MTRGEHSTGPTLQAHHLEAVGAGVSEPVLIIDDSMVVRWGNQAARQAFKTGEKGLVGRCCYEVIRGRRRPCDPASTLCPIATVRLSGEPESCEVTLEDAQGKRAPWVLTVRPIQGSGQEPTEYVLTRQAVQAQADVWGIIQQQSDDLALIHKLIELANQGCEPTELVEAFSKGVRGSFAANYTSFYTLDAAGQSLELATTGIPTNIQRGIERILQAPIPRVVVPLERAPLHMAALHSPTAVLVPDRAGLLALMAENTDQKKILEVLTPILRLIGMSCGALIPLRIQGRPFGLIAVGRKVQLTDAEIRRLQNLGNQMVGITARLQLQAERRRLTHRQTLLLQAVAEGVLGLNGDGEVVFANASAGTLLGRSQDQLQGRSIHDFCGQKAPDQQSCGDACPVHRTLRDRRAHYEVEGTIRSLDGLLRPVRMSAVPLDEPELSVVITLRDISEQLHHREQERRSTERLRRSFSGTVAALRRLAEMRDPYTAGHERRVAQLARAIAQRLDLDEDVVDIVRLAATIHDIGKHAVPVEILTKPGQLSPHEWELIRTHPMVGWEILSQAEFPDPIATIVRQHHERLDGSGYPDGLTDEGITMEARIIAVADVVEAMASHRPYRAAKGLEDALYEIQRHKGSHFDPQVVSVCLRVFRHDGFSFE